MPNSDNTFGTFNKNTIEFTIVNPTAFNTTWQSHLEQTGDFVEWPDVNTAKTAIFTTEALTVFDECCTNLQWGLKADGSGNNTILVVTFDFGTKGTAGISEADDWAGQFNTRRQALVDSARWMADHFAMASAESSSHLF